MKAFTFLEALRWRYATKNFDVEKKIPDDLWDSLESILTLTPSGYGLQPWKFILVKNPEVRKALLPHSLDQPQLVECSHFLVFASKVRVDESYIDRYIEEVSSIRSVPKANLSGFYQMMVDDLIHGHKSKWVSEWSARQAYIALGSLLTAAAVLNVDACPLEGIIPEKYDEILNLHKSGYRTVVACAFGYRKADDVYAQRIKVRFDKSQVFEYV